MTARPTQGTTPPQERVQETPSRPRPPRCGRALTLQPDAEKTRRQAARLHRQTRETAWTADGSTTAGNQSPYSRTIRPMSPRHGRLSHFSHQTPNLPQRGRGVCGSHRHVKETVIPFGTVSQNTDRTLMLAEFKFFPTFCPVLSVQIICSSGCCSNFLYNYLF